MSSAWCPPDIVLKVLPKGFNFCLIIPENLSPHALRVLLMLFGNLQVGCHMPFTQSGFLLGSLLCDYKGLIGVLLGWSFLHPVLSSLQKTSEVRQQWLLDSFGYLRDQGLVTQANSRKSLVSKLHFTYTEATALLGTLQVLEITLKKCYPLGLIHASPQFYCGGLQVYYFFELFQILPWFWS